MWSLLILAFGAFVAQTTEYLPIGLLPHIAGDFDVSNSLVGALVTGYAWIAAVTAIPLTLVTVRLNRRTLFLGLLSLLTLANVLSALASSYEWLAVCRVIVALTHGVFWSIIAAFATRVAPRMPAARSTAWVFSGISGAVVFGVPLATAIGQNFGWRSAFGAMAMLGFIAIGAALVALPKHVEAPADIDARLPTGNGMLYAAAAITALGLTAHFCAYTYVLPLLDRVAGVPLPAVPGLLFVSGLAGIAGNAAGGWLSARSRECVVFAIAGIVAVQASLLLGSRYHGLAWIDMAIWGASISLLIVGLQGWILQIAPDRADAASALYVAMFNMGIGSGALLGGIAIEANGLASVLYAGMSCGLLALGALVLTAGTLLTNSPKA
ncbi:MFS transporter [Paraburkholderia azotifigens]|uniref:MFS transporter n=1 Tax=Paraburkholderia azotifigens TaxID=2057004 RepID=UPI00317583A4